MMYHFPSLNLPEADLKIRRSDVDVKVFDTFREKYVKLTPEEWVRQHFLHFLTRHLSYPSGLISVEKSLKAGKKRIRTDAIVYDRSASPLVLMEFKASKVPISKETMFQAARYNRELSVPYLFMSNGIDHYCLQLKEGDGDFIFLDEIPVYGQISSGNQ